MGYFDERVHRVYNSLEDKNIALLKMYKQASEDIQAELLKITSKLVDNGVVSISELHRHNRLKNILEANNKVIKKLGGNIETYASENMKDGYLSLKIAISDKLGIEPVPNQEIMEELLKKPWKGSYFSERLWDNQKELAKFLNKELLIGLQQGRTIGEIAIKLDNVMQKGFNAAHRLVRTETMHYLNESALQSYKDAGVEFVEDLVTIDERTSEQCKAHDGEIYPIYKVPTLPRHPNCRCTLIPVLDDEIIAQERLRQIGFKSAGDGTSEEVGEPQHLGDIDFNDKKKVIETLKHFENEFKNDTIEHNIVVTSDGKVWHVKGNEGTVNPAKITEKGSKLEGSYSYHNHPKEATNYSFSKEDVGFFLENGEQYAIASDYKYRYIMERTAETKYLKYDSAFDAFDNSYLEMLQDVSDKKIDIDIDFDGYHDTINRLSEKFSFVYRRENVK